MDTLTALVLALVRLALLLAVGLLVVIGLYFLSIHEGTQGAGWLLGSVVLYALVR